ncbi:class GN sortase [Colwellia sp. 75C3]|uniref:class GN sortase n=1 Tax=Colwellia sp. 75C3 TaxID=888425 RepID=UPI000C346AEF|nr:class GN sortase [Colwellia sp. 75C3]PKG83490.1 class GN sortase [Colwellia sp. 75C3]
MNKANSSNRCKSDSIVLTTNTKDKFSKNPYKIILLSLIVIACLLLIKPSYLYAKSVLAQVLLKHAWQETQQTYLQAPEQDKQQHSQEKYLPWQWADSYPVAKLTYKKNNVSWIIMAGMTGRAMAFAPTWLEDSAKPNQYGNTVISAHNDSHFNVLEDSDVGEEFLLEDQQGKILTYRITTINIVSEYDVSSYLFQDETMITLITCYPFEVTNKIKTQRLVIQAVKYNH